MGLFTKVKPETARRRPTVVLRAAGARIDLTNRASVQLLVGTKQVWQTDAWLYRDKIPELRFGAKFIANAIGRVQFIGAMTSENGADPVPFWKKPPDLDPALAQAVEDELARLPFSSGTKFQGKMAENNDIAGEFWLHGWTDAITGRERWEVLSVDEVVVAPDGTISLKNGRGQIRHIVQAANEEIIRMWVQHPRFSEYADSPLRALMDVCQEIILNGRERRAVSRSRFSSNGILLIPEGLSLSSSTSSPDDPGDADTNPFIAELTAAMAAPINNEGDPGGVVPAVIQGNPDDLDKVRLIRLDREDSQVILSKLDNAIGRLGTGLDIPREILSGMGDSNHWSAWQIDASTYRYHIDPRCRLLADGLTEGFLWPALAARGQFTPEQIATVQVWFDATSLTENPNRTQDAKDAYDRAAIGGKSLRDALGFGDEDAPNQDEMLRQIALRTGMDPITAGSLLQRMLEPGKPIIYPTRDTNTTRDDTNGPAQTSAQTSTSKPLALPATPSTPSGNAPAAVPQTGQGSTAPAAPSSVAASALAEFLLAAAEHQNRPDWRVNIEASRELMEIERNLRDRLIVAADAAMARVLERAGSRVRSRTNGKPDVRAKLEGYAVEEFAAILTEQGVMELGLDLDALLAGAFDELKRKFVDWATLGASRAARVALKLLGLSATSDDGKRVTQRIESELGGRVDGAWQRFSGGLRKLAAKHLYSPPGLPEKGEHNGTTVPTSLVRDALADVGGTLPGAAHNEAPQGGLTLGETVSTAIRDEGGQDVGYEWVYGITTLDREFHPHAALDGLRFSGWRDQKLSTALDPEGAWVGDFFHPGDHSGCMCDYVPVWAIPEYKADLEALQVNSPNAESDRQLADLDRAAGRHNTTAALAAAERERIQELQQRFIDRN